MIMAKLVKGCKCDVRILFFIYMRGLVHSLFIFSITVSAFSADAEVKVSDESAIFLNLLGKRFDGLREGFVRFNLYEGTIDKERVKDVASLKALIESTEFDVDLDILERFKSVIPKEELSERVEEYFWDPNALFHSDKIVKFKKGLHTDYMLKNKAHVITRTNPRLNQIYNASKDELTLRVPNYKDQVGSSWLKRLDPTLINWREAMPSLLSSVKTIDLSVVQDVITLKSTPNGLGNISEEIVFRRTEKGALIFRQFKVFREKAVANSIISGGGIKRVIGGDRDLIFPRFTLVDGGVGKLSLIELKTILSELEEGVPELPLTDKTKIRDETKQ